MNNTYTIYNLLTGQVKGTINCPEDDISFQVIESTEGFIEGNFDETYQINLDTLQAEKITLIYPEYPAYYLHELRQYIHDDIILDKAIQNMGEDPVTYKQDNYAILRKWAYPDSFEFIDAAVKQKTTKSKKEGDKQMDNYVDKCLDIKNRFPKKTE